MHFMKELLGKDRRFYLMGVAILIIIGLHFFMYSAFPKESVWGFLFSKGYIGVDIFLFISSYGLCFSFNKNSLADYYKRRAIRIYPAYLVFLIITLIFYGKSYSEPIWQLFVFQVTGLASFRQTDFEWYVPALIVVYVAFPLLYKGLLWLYKKNKNGILLIAIALSVFAPFLSKVMFPMFASRLSIIVLGIATYFALSNDDKSFLLKLFSICAVFALLFQYGEGTYWSILVPGILLLLAESGMKFPLEREIAFLGKHSLEIYLAQCFAFNHFFLSNIGMQFWQKTIIAFVIIVVGSILLNYVQKGSRFLFPVK